MEQAKKDEMSKRDYILLIDKSGSMETKDCPGGKSRWEFAKEQTLAMAQKCAEFDQDGIDVIFFAGTQKVYNNVTPEKVANLYHENSPSGATDTAAALKLVFDEYNKKKAAGNAKPITVVVMTDGEPTDQKAVDKVIVDHANSLGEDNETGITFLQIGADQGARAFLKHLDDELQSQGAKFDIVDTKDQKEMEEIGLVDILMQAVTD